MRRAVRHPHLGCVERLVGTGFCFIGAGRLRYATLELDLQAMETIKADKEPLPLCAEPAVLRSGQEVERFSFLGVAVEVLVSSHDTTGAWSLVVCTAPAHFRGLAAHRHLTMTERFHILAGRLHFQVAGHDRVVVAGESITVVPGLVHSFSNPYDQPAKVLIFCSPGGVEGFYRELAGIVARAPTWPPVDLSRLPATASAFDTFQP
jgi:mannose-6-phosphate isomerase-like protein (cupin superfamily)